MRYIVQVLHFLNQHKLDHHVDYIDMGVNNVNYILNHEDFDDFQVLVKFADLPIRRTHKRYIMFAGDGLTHTVYGLTKNEYGKYKSKIKQRIYIYEN